jgi:hypothetical protein
VSALILAGVGAGQARGRCPYNVWSGSDGGGAGTGAHLFQLIPNIWGEEIYFATMTNTKKRPTEEQSDLLNNIEEFLREMIELLEPERNEKVGRGRPRVLPAMCLWAGMLVCVLRGMGSQLAIWRLLASHSLWDYPRFPVSDQAIYKRLEEAGTADLERLFAKVSRVLGPRLEPYSQDQLAPFATEVVAVDASTLDPVARTLPMLREVAKGDRQLLRGKLAGVFNIRFQQWQHVQHVVNPDENDKVVSRSLLAHIQPGALILADLGYFGFEWFDDLTDSGYFWLSRLRNKTSYEVIHTFYEQGDTFDGLIFLGAYRADRAKHAVRLITFRRGKTLYRYITNVLDPHKFTLHDIAVLYARRWDIEMAFKLIKRNLGLYLFWSAKTDVILQQVWAVLIIAQILHALQLEIAGRAGVDPFDVSLPLMVEYIPKWSYDGTDMIAVFVEHGRAVGFIRPSRRIRIETPEIDLTSYEPLPPGLKLERKPRYARRNCGPRPKP